jgi:hypothetical protein
VLAVEHPKDPVPKLDARPNPLATNWVTVRQDFAGANPLEQHQMAGYRQTAQQIDAQPANAGLAKMREELAGFAGKSSGQVYYFELERVP